jgi:rubrerythrin
MLKSSSARVYGVRRPSRSLGQTLSDQAREVLKMRIRYVLSGVAVLATFGLFTSTALAAPTPSSLSPYPPLSDTSPSAAPGYTSVNQLLNSAAVTEAAAYMQYWGYAAGADQRGRTDLANVWRSVAKVEHQDHYIHEITLSVLYSGTDNIANLQIAVTQAPQAAKADEGWMDKAPKGSAAAFVLGIVAARERAAARLLTQALNALQGQGGSVPAAPPVQYVAVKVSPKPHYSGDFYNDLTGDSNSAVAVAAWQWAEYQWMAKVAVSTGHADLGALLSGLEALEAQNWIELSNVAGYVNGIRMNLQSSIASEQEAIDMYAAWASRADHLCDPSVASVFRSVEGDEQGHHQTFTTELEKLAR